MNGDEIAAVRGLLRRQSDVIQDGWGLVTASQGLCLLVAIRIALRVFRELSKRMSTKPRVEAWAMVYLGYG